MNLLMQGMGDFLSEMAVMMSQTKPNVSYKSSLCVCVCVYIL